MTPFFVVPPKNEARRLVKRTANDAFRVLASQAPVEAMDERPSLLEVVVRFVCGPDFFQLVDVFVVHKRVILAASR